MTPQKPLPVTTDKHPAYTKAIRWVVGRDVLHRQSQCLNNRIEQDHRALKQRYYPMLGFRLASAERFCAAFEELRQYLRVKPGSDVGGETSGLCEPVERLDGRAGGLKEPGAARSACPGCATCPEI
jgi:hypothetical protein